MRSVEVPQQNENVSALDKVFSRLTKTAKNHHDPEMPAKYLNMKGSQALQDDLKNCFVKQPRCHA